MKNILSLITLSFFSLTLGAQTFGPGINIVDGQCDGYKLEVDGITLNRSSNCVHETPQVAAGQTYTVSATDYDQGNLNGISTIDLVEIQRGMLFGFDSPEKIYAADYDNDGVVSTYDLIKLRATILGVTEPIDNVHLIKANETIPNLDPFDINVDYSTLEFTQDDYQGDALLVKAIKLGDVR